MDDLRELQEDAGEPLVWSVELPHPCRMRPKQSYKFLFRGSTWWFQVSRVVLDVRIDSCYHIINMRTDGEGIISPHVGIQVDTKVPTEGDRDFQPQFHIISRKEQPIWRFLDGTFPLEAELEFTFRASRVDPVPELKEDGPPLLWNSRLPELCFAPKMKSYYFLFRGLTWWFEITREYIDEKYCHVIRIRRSFPGKGIISPYVGIQTDTKVKNESHRVVAVQFYIASKVDERIWIAEEGTFPQDAELEFEFRAHAMPCKMSGS